MNLIIKDGVDITFEEGDTKWVSVESILSVIENSHKYPKDAGMKLKYIKDQLTKANTKVYK